MRRTVILIGVALASVTGFVAAQSNVPAELAAMADTERAFAKAATVKGWRDAFLEFFADDAIAFANGVTSAKERLRQQPSTPFSVFELLWEPRLGDVAASGDLGWLTGPSTSINHAAKDNKPGHGCYLSIWRKQADGTWRVFIDVGASAPEPVTFASGFNRINFGERYVGKETGKDARKSLSRRRPRSQRSNRRARRERRLCRPRHAGVAAPPDRVHAGDGLSGDLEVAWRARVCLERNRGRRRSRSFR